MKNSYLMMAVMVLVTGLSVNVFADRGMGPGGDSDRDGVFEHGKGRPMMDRGDRPDPMEKMGWMLPNPEGRTIAEKYRLKMEKTFLEAKETKLPLDAKRRELMQKLDKLAETYVNDQSVSKDIVAVTKELKAIQEKIRGINQTAMEKIRLQNNEREKEMAAATDAWIKKIESNQEDMENYVKWVNDKPAFGKRLNKGDRGVGKNQRGYNNKKR